MTFLFAAITTGETAQARSAVSLMLKRDQETLYGAIFSLANFADKGNP